MSQSKPLTPGGKYDFSCAAVVVTEGVAEVVLTATGKGQRMGPDYWTQFPTLFEQLDADEHPHRGHCTADRPQVQREGQASDARRDAGPQVTQAVQGP